MPEVDTAFLSSLIARVRELEVKYGYLDDRVDRATTVSAILARADAPPPHETGPRPAKPASHRRDRHGLHLVRGAAVAALAWTIHGIKGPKFGLKLGLAGGLALAAWLIAAVPPVTLDEPGLVGTPTVAATPVHPHHHRAADDGFTRPRT
jgi:hypothetical protein